MGNCDNERHIRELENILPDFIFCPDVSKWKYKCTKCGHVGEKHLDGLKNGKKGCKCSSTYRWSKEEREEQIRKIVEEEDNLVDFSLEKYVTTVDSVLLVECCLHGNFKCTVNNFVNHSSRCPICSRDISLNGLYESKKDTRDYLYLLTLENGEETFVKIGRSFNPDRRIKTIERTSKYKVTEKLILKESSHYEIFNHEKEILSVFSKYRITPLNYFAGFTECFRVEVKDEIKNFIETESLK